MTWRVVFEAAAQADVMEAAVWHDRRVPDLGDAFVAEVDAAVEWVAAQPMLYPTVRKERG